MALGIIWAISAASSTVKSIVAPPHLIEMMPMLSATTENPWLDSSV